VIRTLNIKERRCNIKKKLYTIRYDKVFKHMMCNEKIGTLLIAKIIEEVVGLKVDNVTILNSELKVKNINTKKKSVDCLVLSNNKIINIEVNNGYYKGLRERNVSYIMNNYVNDIEKGSSYKDFKEHIQINLSWGVKNNKLIGHYELTDKIDNENFIKNLDIYEVNMEKLLSMYYNSEKETRKFKYLTLLTLENKIKIKEYIEKGEELMGEFMTELEKFNEYERLTRGLPTEEEDRIKVENTLKLNAYEEGFEQGIKDGLEKGIKEGKKEGIKEGIKENTKFIVKNMIENGNNYEFISKITGLSIDEIKKISEN